MAMETRTTYDEMGAYVRILEFEDSHSESSQRGDDGWHSQFESIVLRVPPDETDTFTCRAFVDDEVVYENTFTMRDLSFDPVSALGRGESSRVAGVSETEGDDTDYGNVPRDVSLALNHLGFTLVPNGEWWLDG